MALWSRIQDSGLVSSITSRHYTRLPTFQHANLRILIDERRGPVSACSLAHRTSTVILFSLLPPFSRIFCNSTTFVPDPRRENLSLTPRKAKEGSDVAKLLKP